MPGMTVAETLPFRDKVVMKEHLRAAGIRVPEFAPYARDAAAALLARHGCVVTKPRLGAGSAEVSILRTQPDIEAFERRVAGRLDEFEVEAFVGGELFHVDSVVRRGRVVVATAGRSIDDTRNFELGLPFRDLAVAPGALLDELLAFNAAVVAAYPNFVGVTHHELFETRDGIVFCEIAGRAGGGGIIAGFRSRTGWSLDEVLLRAQVYDDVPAELPVAPHLTGYALVYVGPGRLVEAPRAVAEPWVIETQLHAAAGAWLDAPADWGDAVAIVTVVGDSEEQVVERLDHVIAETTAQVRVDQTEVGPVRP
jgi:biotin carboxylase